MLTKIGYVLGEGEMFNLKNKLYDEFFEIFKNLSPACQDFLLKTAKNLLHLQNNF